MVGWHQGFSGHGFGCAPGADDGQGGLACCMVPGVAKSRTRLSDWTETEGLLLAEAQSQ